MIKGAYQDLQVTVLGRETGSEKGVTNRVATLLANQIKVRHENKPDKAGAMKEGKIDYARLPEETFLAVCLERPPRRHHRSDHVVRGQPD